MKILRFIDGDGCERLGCDPRDGDAQVLEGELPGGWQSSGRRLPVRRVLSPLVPAGILGIGLNYREHVRLMGAELPRRPVVFMKPTTSVIGPGDPIPLPPATEAGSQVDYECELAVVLGRAVRDVPVAQALECVLGYTVANDVTERAWARVSRTRGKGFDGFCPLGPVLVTADEIGDPQGLALETTLNGERVQQGSTADMIFPVAELISYLSAGTTLPAGTVILTGTPPGSGVTRKPPVYLRPGDRVAVRVERIGTLENTVGTGAATPLAGA
jgi:2-keto-4-pentenoate hydratase/2-oxohepta-3-ene-1,7-dioic acid hydratase in catechol pathway